MKNSPELDFSTCYLNKHSAVPLYQQLTDILRARIEAGKLNHGDPLPSEAQLLKTFNVSRTVVRQAVTNLVKQGLAYTEHGRGSFVNHRIIEKPLDLLQSYHDSMKKAGIAVNVKIVNKGIIATTEEISNRLGIKQGQRVFYLERVAFLEDEPLNFLISYIALEANVMERLQEFNGGSLYNYLNQELNIQLCRSQSYIEIISAGDTETRLLRLPRNATLIQISSLVFDKSDCAVEYTRIVYPGHRFKFWFESYWEQNKSGDSRIFVR